MRRGEREKGREEEKKRRRERREKREERSQGIIIIIRVDVDVANGRLTFYHIKHQTNLLRFSFFFFPFFLSLVLPSLSLSLSLSLSHSLFPLTLLPSSRRGIEMTQIRRNIMRDKVCLETSSYFWERGVLYSIC